MPVNSAMQPTGFKAQRSDFQVETDERVLAGGTAYQDVTVSLVHLVQQVKTVQMDRREATASLALQVPLDPAESTLKKYDRLFA